ncbi:MAG: PQQ-binding-like beta-propeller repeat protein [Thermoguttaceae bacterium]
MRTNWIMTVLAWGCFAVWTIGTAAAADDWPGWRGSQRDGHIANFTSPNAWPKALQRQWKIKVGDGHASPVVDRGTVFVFSREDEQEVVRAIKLSDGQQIWRESYPARYTMCPAARSHGKGPKSTPILANGRLVTLGISGILSAWDTKTGKLLWQQEFAGKYKTTSPLYGTAMSPLVHAGNVVAHVGGQDGGTLAAFDLETGKPQWQWDGDGPGYASPILATLEGVPQVITQSQGKCIAVSAADGSLLWSMPFETPYVQNIVTPVVVDDLVVFSGINKGTTAYRLENSQGKWSPTQVWHNDDISMYMTSPVAVNGSLFGLTPRKKGQFFCLDLKTGKTLWTSEGRMGDNAAVLCTENVVLALTTGSELLAFKPSTEEFDLLARYKVADSPTWAHPAIVGRQVLVKDRTSLTVWSIPD